MIHKPLDRGGFQAKYNRAGGAEHPAQERPMSQRAQPGARVRVRVQPKSSRNQVVGYRGDTLRLRVTAPPEGGQANEAVVSLLAKVLGIAKSRIEIVRGHASRDKMVVVWMAPEEVRRRLEAEAN